MMSQIHRIGLGTAQFGSHYGITNSRGRPSRKKAEQIIRVAYESGIRNFDTSPQYGDAAAILAASLPGPARVTSRGDPGFISIYWDDPDLTGVKIVQLPLNISDRRNLPLVRRLHDSGIEVHARSIFLQGLLLLRGATVRQCLKFVLDQPVDVALVGVNSLDELKQIIEAVGTLDQEQDDYFPWIEPEKLDPRQWSIHANH